ncbi:MAG TPA: ADP-ribosylglycohydrolase family protein [Leptospiraceae bacterium]|nr:ADP-ribosylglycohydrolase family protein [Leptospiraceae bacterium]HMY66616.1 ADP-ribosylglycohydrolase family protein [Leptospiraceae bacterium]HNF17006.1 ADP-ribosylglycohydrolase family protein [Leptospiraceae bacterium]HNM05126.1 ADP-ribosylglycohydrolase family protein [Leptospiraceae bacterium]HNN04070.1 ADP-ribosylglycohydrolase family protein [Leptospiraceae bacterium]
MMTLDNIRGSLLGLAAADAAGVPYEFKDRNVMKQNPALDMTGYGTHGQPPGTWSDDSSLSFCLAETLAEGFDLNKLADKFLRWKENAYWTAHGSVFDIGITTSASISRYARSRNPYSSGAAGERENGNGSLMRILPLIFYIQDMNEDERFRIVKEVSSVTHSHIISVLACFIYTEYSILILKGGDRFSAYFIIKEFMKKYIQDRKICTHQTLSFFKRILDKDSVPIYELKEKEIHSGGFVVDTLEASLWAFLSTENYKDAVLRAVNLGDDTDTTACAAGGLAGLYYGSSAIPEHWLSLLAGREDIEALAERLFLKLEK